MKVAKAKAKAKAKRRRNRELERDKAELRSAVITRIRSMARRWGLAWHEVVELVMNPIGEGDDGCDEVTNEIIEEVRGGAKYLARMKGLGKRLDKWVKTNGAVNKERFIDVWREYCDETNKDSRMRFLDKAAEGIDVPQAEIGEYLEFAGND